VRPITREEDAWTLHETILEILRRLNQAAEEGFEVHALELPEIERAMAPFWATHHEGIALAGAIGLLEENGLIAALDDPQYSWVRNRTVGRRYGITTLGKRYLVRQLEESGRIR
jgi:hypothetical protein